MAKDAYQKLRKHLDGLPGGYPATGSGVEMRILKRLFNREEAELAVKLTLIPEEAKIIARRAKMGVDECREKLDEMSCKGLIFSYDYQGVTHYMAAQFVVGIWEYHVNDLDPELIRDMNEYIPHIFTAKEWKKGPQLRTIPVGRSLSAQAEVLPHEKAEELVIKHKKFLVAPCICRREHEMVGEGCDKTMESCLVFGAGVDYYEKNGLGRRISREEVLEIIKLADQEGMVLQPTHSKKITNICCCCGCCCQVLKNLKRYPDPGTLVASPFLAEAEPSECIGCEVCVDRCQMEALTMAEDANGDDKVVLEPGRCIGCGLCVTTCPTGSLTLQRKPEDQQASVPRNVVESRIMTGKARGTQGAVDLALMLIKSKVDRLLAAGK